MKENNYFSSNLKYLRQSKGYTQGQLGEMISVDQTTIGRWEDGNREPTVGNVLNISKIFNVNINDLLSKDLRDDNMTDLINMGNDLKLIDAIGSFAEGKYAELLTKCAILSIDNRDKILELVDMYLKEQDNMKIDKNGNLEFNGFMLYDRNNKKQNNSNRKDR